MSGNYVQRGELAVIDKYVRAEAAIRCGADIVLELPYPWSCGSAEYFSHGAVGLYSAIAVSYTHLLPVVLKIPLVQDLKECF